MPRDLPPKDWVAPRIDRVSRLIAATPATVYQAFLSAADVAAWLPPQGMTAEIHEFDPRPGGPYRMTLRIALGHGGKSSDDSDVVEGRFGEMVPDRRIEQRVRFRSDDPDFSGEMLMTWQFLPAQDGCEVVVSCANVPKGIAPGDHLAALASTLDNLAAHLA